MHIHYPVARTALYLVPLFTVAVIFVARMLARLTHRWWFKAACVAVALVALADYALSLNTKYFRYNEYDLVSRRLFQTIDADARSRGLTDARVGGTWWYQPEIDFYTRRYHSTVIAPFDIVDRSYWWNSPNALAPAQYDYFVFTPSNDPHFSGPQFRTIFQDSQFGVTVEAHDR